MEVQIYLPQPTQLLKAPQKVPLQVEKKLVLALFLVVQLFCLQTLFRFLILIF